jgi:hypothetical protein
MLTNFLPLLMLQRLLINGLVVLLTVRVLLLQLTMRSRQIAASTRNVAGSQKLEKIITIINDDTYILSPFSY